MNVRACGDLPPPMVLFVYKRTPHQIVKKNPQTWGVGISDNGWMTAQTFYEYVANVFYPWIINEKITLPIILFVDGHSSHLTLPLSEFCEEHIIVRSNN